MSELMVEKTPTIQSHRAAQELFDRTVEDYETRATGRVFRLSSMMFVRRMETVLRMLDETGASGTVLDCGMGPGLYARAVVERGFHFLGIDLSEAMVTRAKTLGIPNTTYVQGDIEDLGKFRESADVVLAIGLIDYLEYPEAGIQKLAECLKPGGYLIVAFRNKRALVTVLRDLARAAWRLLFKGSKFRRDSAFVSKVHENAFSFRTDLAPMLKRLGMQGATVRYFRFSLAFADFPIPRPIWTVSVWLDRYLAGRWTRWSCSGGIVRARKPPMGDHRPA